jgi:hypothetical protein
MLLVNHLIMGAISHEATEAALDEWKETQKSLGLDPEAILELIESQGPSGSGDAARAMEEHFTSHVQLPSREEMEKMLIERRKKVRKFYR